MKIIIKLAIGIVLLGVVVAGWCWYAARIVTSHADYGVWLANKAFLRQCDPASTHIYVWNLNTSDKHHTYYEMPQKYVPQAINKLLDMKLSRWTKAPINDVEDLKIMIKCGKKKRVMYGWSNRQPYFSISARGETGPWFVRFTEKND